MVLTPDLRTIVLSETVRAGTAADWYVYRGGLDPTESHLLLSYHGPDTTGVDLITLTDDRLVDPCTQPAVGCIASHGGFLVTRDRIFFTTGSSTVIETDTAGQPLRDIETGIENEHIMEMTLDSTGSHLFIVGSCLYSDGLFAVDVSSMKTQTLAKQLTDVCGERVLVVGASQLVVFDPKILLIDAETGRVEVGRTPSDAPVDGLPV
ncbi:MAG TPA: hypothetical protein VHQ03_10380 [Candidatus Dormibacteraeota bacterium]|jgi:hypothetical protein|nr:hypothetical protein [Candidatus Dormibacteraeota bacterium]